MINIKAGDIIEIHGERVQVTRADINYSASGRKMFRFVAEPVEQVEERDRLRRAFKGRNMTTMVVDEPREWKRETLGYFPLDSHDKIVETDAAYRARICTIAPYASNDVALQTAIGRDLDVVGTMLGVRRREQTRAEAYDDYNQRRGALSVKVDPDKSYRKGDMVVGVYDPKNVKVEYAKSEGCDCGAHIAHTTCADWCSTRARRGQ